MKKLLFIEDNISLFNIYQEIFRSQEVTVLGATTGEKGLALVQSEKPDIILLDIMLPGGKNGFDVLEQLKADPSTRQIPVIILTNLDSEEKTAKIIGATDYLVKANTTKDQIVNLVMERLKSPQPA